MGIEWVSEQIAKKSIKMCNWKAVDILKKIGKIANDKSLYNFLSPKGNHPLKNQTIQFTETKTGTENHQFKSSMYVYKHWQHIC